MPKENLYTDPQLHAQHVAFLRARSQARFRKEEWSLTLEDYFTLWKDSWSQRGRSRDSLVLCRIDLTEGWTLDNVEITTRYEQLLKKFISHGYLRSAPNYQPRTYNRRKRRD